MLGLRRSTGERGDTIVEVLIAIAIVGLVLASAYATSNRSTLNIQDAQERSEALKLAQSQIELMRTYGTFTAAEGICYNMPDGVTPRATDGTPVLPSNPDGCKVNAAGQPTTSQPQYVISISTDANDVKTVLVTWPSLLSGAGNNTLSLFYRPTSE